MTDNDGTPRILGGRYEVGEHIGRGGMAEVYLGHDTRLGRTVAIKMLRADLARDHTFLARFRREAQSAAGLNHHSIVSVYDSGEDVFIETGGARVDVPYIVMEYVDGRTLREILNDEGHLPPDEAARITMGILAALEYSHEKGIVHRDIKPANVMVTRGGSVKVMDFGIARALADASATMTTTQSVVGTARYLSPEQAQGETVDQRSDLYSAGCVLYELLAGRTPFVGEPVSLVYQHIKDAPARPSDYQASVPDTMDAVTLHALEKPREGRYQSAGEFRSDLQAARVGGPVSAAAAGSLAAVEADAGAALRAKTDGSGAGRGDQGGDGSDDTAELSKSVQPKRRTALWLLAALVAVGAIFGIGYLMRTPEKPPRVAVPAVENISSEQAQQILRGDGFQPSVRQVTADADEGQVVRQSPAANTSVDRGSTVTIDVSTGPSALAVPDVRGRTETQARAQLTAAGFSAAQIEVAQTRQDDTTYSSGQVSSTSPAIGSSMPRAGKLTLRLSSGRVTVPDDLLGQSPTDAAVALNRVGLRVRQPITERITDNASARGTVISVPRAGDKVDLGTAVQLVVGIAPKETVTSTTTPSPTSTPSTSTSEPSTSTSTSTSTETSTSAPTSTPTESTPEPTSSDPPDPTKSTPEPTTGEPPSP